VETKEEGEGREAREEVEASIARITYFVVSCSRSWKVYYCPVPTLDGICVLSKL